MKYSQHQGINSLSLNLLSKLGNNQPSSEQIRLMEITISKIAIIQDMMFLDTLTPREVSCLYWAAMGKTSRQTARLLNIQASTVEQYRKETKKKLDCKTIAEAVFKGIRLGYLTPTYRDKKHDK